MSSVSTGHLLMFIIILVVTSSMAGTLANEVTRLGQTIEDTSLDLRETVTTDVEIVGETGTDVYDAGTENVTVYLWNAGPRRLDTAAIRVTVLVDDEAYGNVTVTDMNGGDHWLPGERVRVDVDTGPLSGPDHDVTVIVNGDEERIRAEP